MLPGSAPWLLSDSRTSLDPSMAITSALNLETIPRGVPAGAKSPYHSVAS